MKKDQTQKIKTKHQLKTFKQLKKGMANIKTLITWFLISLPFNFMITIALFYQLSQPASYLMLVKIFGLIIANVLLSALIYWLINLIKRKIPKKHMETTKHEKGN